MKIVHLTNSDYKGGAARACYRIHKSLQMLGEDSKILTQQKVTNDDSVFSISGSFSENVFTTFRKGFDWLAIQTLTKQERGRFTFPYFGTDISKNELIQNADIISLQWINEGFLSLNSLKKLKSLDKPIVWTCHDMWAFTGGCHYAGDCDKYLSECKNCPSLKISSKKDFSNKTFNAKKDLYNSMNLSIITCSNWLAGEVTKSELLKNKVVQVIPNPIETDIYIQYDKNVVRKKLNLPEDKFLILFVSMTVKDERKGFSYLKSGLKKLFEINKQNNIELVVLGAAEESLIHDLPFKTNLLGRLNEAIEIAE
ncbi:MAG: glycosyltransferase, partial [Melioribacteraceae bacterium]